MKRAVSRMGKMDVRVFVNEHGKEYIFVVAVHGIESLLIGTSDVHCHIPCSSGDPERPIAIAS